MKVNGTSDAVLAVARSQIGYRERPVNRTKYGVWFGMDGVAWCAMWASWCFWHAGAPLPAIQTAKGFALVRALVAWAKKDGSWRPRGSGYVPKPGDLIVFQFHAWPDHVAIVQRRLADGRDLTVEGNTNAGGSRTGGMVAEHNRATRIVGYVEVTYSGAAPVTRPPAPAPTPAPIPTPAPAPAPAPEPEDVPDMTLFRLDLPGNAQHGRVILAFADGTYDDVRADEYADLQWLVAASGGRHVNVPTGAAWVHLFTHLRPRPPA